MRTRLDLLKPNLEQRVTDKQAAQKSQHDQHTRQRYFIVGQRVMAKNLRPGPAWVPGTITEQLEPLTFHVRVQNGQMWKRHMDHLKASGDPGLSQEQSDLEENTQSEFTYTPRSETVTEQTTQQPTPPSMVESNTSTTDPARTGVTSSSMVPSTNHRYPSRVRQRD